MVNSPKGHWSEWLIVWMVIGPDGQQSEGSLVQMFYSPKVISPKGQYSNVPCNGQ